MNANRAIGEEMWVGFKRLSVYAAALYGGFIAALIGAGVTAVATLAVGMEDAKIGSVRATIAGAIILLVGLFAGVAFFRPTVNRLLPTLNEPGLCAVCEYHLRATPERCPECGTVQDKQDD